MTRHLRHLLGLFHASPNKEKKNTGITMRSLATSSDWNPGFLESHDSFDPGVLVVDYDS